MHTFDATGLQTDGILFQEVTVHCPHMCTNAGIVYIHKEIHAILSLKDEDRVSLGPQFKKQRLYVEHKLRFNGTHGCTG